MPKAHPVPKKVAEDVVAVARGLCERHLARGVSVPGAALHHRVTRARARNLHDRMNCVWLCEPCHTGAAHGDNEWPWLVPGSTIRGRYIGADLTYHAIYNGAADPTPADLQAVFPEAAPHDIVWAWDRMAVHRGT